MDERQEWMSQLFRALTSKKLSRNKYFTAFAQGWAKMVQERYRVVRSLAQQAERLASVPETACWVLEEQGRLYFHLQSPRLGYKRVVSLHDYEWEWLSRHPVVRSLLEMKALTG